MAQLVAFAATYQALLLRFISWDSEGDGELLGWVWRPQQAENSTARGVASVALWAVLVCAGAGDVAHSHGA